MDETKFEDTAEVILAHSLHEAANIKEGIKLEGLEPSIEEVDLPVANEEDGYDSYAVSAIDAASSHPASEEQRIQAYAKLEFADGDFYMTTYAVELGRDRLNNASAPDVGWASSESVLPNGVDSSAVSVQMGEDSDDLPKDSFSLDDTTFHGLDSVSAMEGEDLMSIAPPSRRHSRHSSLRETRKDYNALARLPIPGANKLSNGIDMEEFDLTAPLDCPLIPIQQPQKADGRPVNTKSISRRHARISFNFDKHYFELLFLGRNGGFLDEEWFAPADIQPLVNGSVIQIGGLGVRFVLPDVPPGETGADELEDSQSVEQESGDEIEVDSDDEDDEDEKIEQELDDDDEDEDEDNEDEDEEELEEDEDEATLAKARKGGRELIKLEPEPARVKRKGPGRPPKNGVMSKREQAELARQARDDPSGRKAGMDRGKGKSTKMPEVDSSTLQPNGKRKYTKRKRVEGKESAETKNAAPLDQKITPNKPVKEKRPPKPPRSPSPVWDESKLTAEQLAKPQASYVVLIHEALTHSKTGAMSLPQIYRAIERKYPHFKLRVTTQGWQSSVRHNLGQHAAFRKIERDGKGWMWGIDPDVSIEKERKRRATPPPQTPNSTTVAGGLDNNGAPRFYPQGVLTTGPSSRPAVNYPYSAHQHYSGAQSAPHGHGPGQTVPTGHTYAGQGSGVPRYVQGGFPPRSPYSVPGYPMILNAKAELGYHSPYDTNADGKGNNIPRPYPSYPPHSSSQTTPSSVNSPYLPNPRLSTGNFRPVMNTSNQQHSYPPQRPSTVTPHNSNGSTMQHSNSQQTQAYSNSSQASGSHSRPLLSSHALSAIQKFRHALLSDMDDKGRADRLITSAIERTLDPKRPPIVVPRPENTKEEIDLLQQEKTIMLALSKLLRDLGERNLMGTTTFPTNSQPRVLDAGVQQQQQPQQAQPPSVPLVTAAHTIPAVTTAEGEVARTASEAAEAVMKSLPTVPPGTDKTTAKLS